MAKTYRLTPSRKRALRKAQLISARKRKGKGMSRAKRNALIGGVSTAVLVGGAAYGRHKLSGSSLTFHHGPRTATPMINVVGVQVPGTRAGLRIHRYGGGDFATTYTSRNKNGDKSIFLYRHIPLTKEAVKSAFGMKVKGAPEKVSNWKPETAFPPEVDLDIINAFPNRMGAGRKPGETDRQRWARGAFTPRARAKRRTDNVLSTAKKQNDKKFIRDYEVDERVLDYERQLRQRGIIPNRSHLFAATRLIRRQVY